MELGLSGKVALVTGAGQGVGRGIARMLAAEGVAVAVNDFYAERAQAVCEEIRLAGGAAAPAVADVTDFGAVSDMVSNAAEKLGSVDILVNNAGIPPRRDESERAGHYRPFAETSPADWSGMLDVNIFGALNCTHAVLGAMTQRRSGKIVSIISEAGRVGEPKLATYSAAKAAVLGFTRAIAKEVGPHRINVNCVALGAVDADGRTLDEVMGEEHDFFAKVIRSYPIGLGLNRFSNPDDVAGAVAFLASDRSAYVTGQCLSLSGGYAMI